MNDEQPKTITVEEINAERARLDARLSDALPELTPEHMVAEGLGELEAMAYLEARQALLEKRAIPKDALQAPIPANLLAAELQRLGVECKLLPGDMIHVPAFNRHQKRRLRAKFVEAKTNILKRFERMGMVEQLDSLGNVIGYKPPEN